MENTSRRTFFGVAGAVAVGAAIAGVELSNGASASTTPSTANPALLSGGSSPIPGCRSPNIFI